MYPRDLKPTLCKGVVLSLFFIVHAATQAQIPQTISYQGVLTDVSGNVVQDGNYDLTFNLYDVATGGTVLWSEEQSVVIIKGIFNTILGSINPLSLSFDRPYWLGITVGEGSELTPRIQLTSSAYSFRSVNADSVNGISASDTPTPHHLFPLGPDSKFPETVLPPGLPPSGTAGGDLTGAYPNPTIAENAVTAAKIQPDILSSVDSVRNDGGNVDLIAGSNITIDTDTVAKTITISATGVGGGDITAVNAGDGLYGGGESGDVTLNVNVPLSLSGNLSGYTNAVISGTNTSNGRGVYGESASGTGVRGQSGSANGVYGTSSSSYGVRGDHTGSGNYGYLGSSSYGVYGESGSGTGVKGHSWFANAVSGESMDGNGVYGASEAGVGVQGTNLVSRNYGDLGSFSYGVFGESLHDTGVRGISFSAHGVYGSSTIDVGVYGKSTNSYGVYGVSSSGSGVAGYSSTSYGVFGGSGSNYAGYFEGNVHVTGTLSKGGGSFKIDHPLDPENKYLYHSFVESPDMMNIYNGIAILDASGEAVVELPAYFQTINKDFRYQLTCIGDYAPVYISQEVLNNSFRIAGGKANMKVSWQVTGIRQDAFANAHRIEVEEEKTDEERGKYLYPTEYGMPETRGIEYEEIQRMKQEMKANEERIKAEQEKLKVMEEQHRQ